MTEDCSRRQEGEIDRRDRCEEEAEGTPRTEQERCSKAHPRSGLGLQEEGVRDGKCEQLLGVRQLRNRRETGADP